MAIKTATVFSHFMEREKKDLEWPFFDTGWKMGVWRQAFEGSLSSLPNAL